MYAVSGSRADARRRKKKGDQTTVREYLALMGFHDLDKPWKIETLRETLLSKVARRHCLVGCGE